MPTLDEFLTTKRCNFAKFVESVAHQHADKHDLFTKFSLFKETTNEMFVSVIRTCYNDIEQADDYIKDILGIHHETIPEEIKRKLSAYMRMFIEIAHQ